MEKSKNQFRNIIISKIKFGFSMYDSFKNYFNSKTPESDLYQKRKFSLRYFLTDDFLIATLKILGSIILGFVIASILINLNINLNFAKSIDSIFFKSVLSSFFIIVALRLLWKNFLYNYQVSINQLAFLIFLVSIYITISSVKCLSIGKLAGIELITTFLLIYFIVFILSFLNQIWPKYGKIQNVFIEDNPYKIEKDVENEDNGIHKKLVEKIKFSLLHDKYESSFSIGIIAPWGTGKSTFIQKIKEEVERYLSSTSADQTFLPTTPKGQKQEKQSLISFDYSPFLNHNEKQLIEDFFTQLSKELGKYSGRLSNLVENYANSLIEVSDNKLVKELHKISKLNYGNNNSVKENFEEVKEILHSLDLKVICYIDDIDRLNPKEIIQILKLIRNTSNFPNFVFIVALDKEYVISALRDLGEYTSRNFIDKFFQLECYLPEIESIELVKEMNRIVNESKIFEYKKDKENINFFKEQLTKVISNDLFLFSTYIRNFRDVKRFVNQLQLEYNNIQDLFEEIELIDYLNVLFLKINYPEFYRFILLNYDSYFEIKNNHIKLKSSLDKAKQNDQLLVDLTSNKSSFNPDLSIYDFGDLTCQEEKNKYSCSDIEIIKKSLFVLFNRYKITTPKSLNQLQNLRKLAYWRIAKTDLSSYQYLSIFEYYNQIYFQNKLSDYSISILNELQKENKLFQFLERISFENINSKQNAKVIVYILFDILILTDEDYITNAKCKEILNKFYNSKQIVGQNNFTAEELEKIDKKEIKLIFENKFVKEKSLNHLFRIDFINDIIRNEQFVGLWYFSKNELLQFQLNILKELTQDYNEENWLPNDYTIWRIFYLVFDYFESEDEYYEKLKNLIIEFCKNKKLNVLFFNLLNPKHFSQLAFRLNQIVDLVFGSTEHFYNFILEEYSVELNHFLEIGHFMKLNILLNNKFDVKFNFSENILIGSFNAFGDVSDLEIQKMRESIQLVFEINIPEYKVLFTIENSNNSNQINRNNKTYYFVNAKESEIGRESLVNNWLLRIKDQLQLNYDNELRLENNKVLYNDEIIVELISNQ